MRNLVLTAAIGTGLVADTFNVADNVPNMLFLLLGGGVIAAVFVPQLVKHAGVSERQAQEYGSILIVSSLIVGGVISALSILLGPWLIASLGGSSWTAATTGLAMGFLMWCAPQILFLSTYWVVAQIMNSRGHFSSVNWLPALSSIIVIAGSIPVLVQGTVTPNDPASADISTVVLIGGSTTLGAAAQAAVLYAMLNRVGFRFRLPGTLRGIGLRLTARVALWAFLSAAAYQFANLVVVGMTTRAGADSLSNGLPGRGYSAFFYAQSLILVISAVLVASLATVLLQRLSIHFKNNEMESAHRELDDAVLRISAATIPISGLLLCLGPVVGQILFARGNTDPAAAAIIGVILAILGLSLHPRAIHNVLIRPFYARSDGRRPLYSALTIGSVWVALLALSFFLLPHEYMVFAAAVSYLISYLVEWPIKSFRLKKHFGFRLQSDTVGAISKLWLSALCCAAMIGIGQWLLTLLPSQPTPLLWVSTCLSAVLFIGLYHVLTRRNRGSLLALLTWLRR